MRFFRSGGIASSIWYITFWQRATFDRIVKTRNTMPQTTGDSDDAKLTVEEAKQLQEAFTDDKFCKLMAEYVSELSDPKYKEE